MSSSSRQEGRGYILHSSAFGSIQTLQVLHEAHAHRGGLVTLLSPPVQMPISSETPSQTHPEIMFNLGAPWPVKVTQQVNLHPVLASLPGLPSCCTPADTAWPQDDTWPLALASPLHSPLPGSRKPEPSPPGTLLSALPFALHVASLASNVPSHGACTS